MKTYLHVGVSRYVRNWRMKPEIKEAIIELLHKILDLLEQC